MVGEVGLVNGSAASVCHGLESNCLSSWGNRRSGSHTITLAILERQKWEQKKNQKNAEYYGNVYIFHFRD